MKYFSQDLSEMQISNLRELSRNAANKILRVLRKRIASLCEQESPFKGEIEVYESFKINIV